MTEASRGRVTITLGRSGQVVKRSGPALNVDFSDSHPDAGSKRSVRDRLGGIVDSSLLHGSQLSNKRQRGDGGAENLNVNGMNDVHIGKHDLRFKIMQKNVHRHGQSDDERKYIDLREKLSRMGQPPLNGYETGQQMPDSRERLHDPRERLPDPRETNILSRIPSRRTAHDVPRVTASGSSLSPWTLDRLRQRSPDRVMDASRGLSPPRNIKELQRRQVNQIYGDVRTLPYMGKDVLDTPRPVISTEAFVTKPSLPTTSAKPIPPGPPILCPIPQTSCSIQKSSFSVVEQQTVEGLLQSLGLGKYAILFKAEEVDMTALKQMGENDLKEIGIPMGPRKKIRLALLPRSKRQP